MPKNKRIIRRKAQSLYPRSRSLASRIAISFTVVLGMAVMGFAFFFHAIYPGETQSSVDRTAWELSDPWSS